MTGYQLDDAGRSGPGIRAVLVVPAVGGLWATAADRHASALRGTHCFPPTGRRGAPASGAAGSPGPRFGLGWPLHPDNSMASLVGSAPGVAASLLFVPGSGHASVTMTSR